MSPPGGLPLAPLPKLHRGAIASRPHCLIRARHHLLLHLLKLTHPSIATLPHWNASDPPPPAMAIGRRSSPWSPYRRPSSAQAGHRNRFLSERWCSQAQYPLPYLTEVRRSRAPMAAVPAPPWNRLLRPPPGEPRPPLGAALAPLTFPPFSPRRRPTPSPGTAAPSLPCSEISVQGPQVKRNKIFRGQTAKCA